MGKNNDDGSEELRSTKEGDITRKKILEYIVSYTTEHCYAPTIREICEGVQLSSTSSVSNHLQKMFELGMIETDGFRGAPRAIRVPGYKFVKIED